MPESFNPNAILEVSNGFKSAKVLLTAAELGVFTELAKGPQPFQKLRQRFGLSNKRSSLDFFDCLVSMGMLDLISDGYINTPETDFYLDKNKPSYIGGLLEMYNDRLYKYWDDFTIALKTGEPQNEAKSGENFFSALYRDPRKLSQFMNAMSGISLIPAKVAAERFPWENHNKVADIGCAQGVFLAEILKAHPHLNGIGFDLKPVQPIFENHIRVQELEDSLIFQSGDFFKDPLPEADVLVFGQILHDWSLKERKVLLEKAHQALPKGGTILIYEYVIDDGRRTNILALLSSLTMLIETQSGHDFTGKECRAWMLEAGFDDIEVLPLAGYESMVIGKKV